LHTKRVNEFVEPSVFIFVLRYKFLAYFFDFFRIYVDEKMLIGHGSNVAADPFKNS
jgi:hypothetical protein